MNTETAHKVGLAREVASNGAEVFVLDFDADKANYSRIKTLNTTNIATTKAEYEELLSRLETEFVTRTKTLDEYGVSQLAKLPRTERPHSIAAVIHPLGETELSDAASSVIQTLMKSGRSHGIQIILSAPLNVFETTQKG